MSTLARWKAIRPAQRLYYGWVLAVTLGITTIISYGTTQYLFGVLVEPMSREFGWSRASLSGAYTFAVVLAGLLGLPIGRPAAPSGASAWLAYCLYPRLWDSLWGDFSLAGGRDGRTLRAPRLWRDYGGARSAHRPLRRLRATHRWVAV